MMLRRNLPPALILLASPAIADITADDVWTNTVAFYQATGGTLTAELNRDGDTVFVDNPVLNYRFPFDAGSLQISMPPMTMVEETDGSVTQKLPKSFDLALDLQTPPMIMGDFSFVTVVTQADFAATATGTAGDITYNRDAAAYGATIEFDVGEEEFGGISMAFEITGDGYAQTTRVTEGDLIEVVSDSTTEPMRYSFRSDEGYGYRSEGNGTYGTTSSRVRMALPLAGLDFTNLAPAFAAGMFVDGTTTTTRSRDESVTYFEDTVATREVTSVGPGQSTLRLSADGLVGSGEVQDIAVMFEENTFTGLNVSVDIDNGSASYRVPFMAADDPQDLNLNMLLTGLTLNDETWDLFNPDGTIPRDPADLRLDLSSTVNLGVDLLDFMGLEAAFAGADVPIKIETLTLDVLDLDVAGVSANGTAAFTFDNDDLETFDGFPRPEGSGTIEITGANGLLDKLIAAGLVPQSEAGMGRMMLGMFTRPTGDDQLTSTLEVNAEGQILVNGERIR